MAHGVPWPLPPAGGSGAGLLSALSRPGQQASLWPLLLLLMATVGTNAYPSLHLGCSLPTAENVAPHGGVVFPSAHPPLLELRDPTGDLVAEFQPGGRHQVQLTTGTDDSIYLAVSHGTLYDATGAVSSHCGGRVLYLGDPAAGQLASAAGSFSFAWEAPPRSDGGDDDGAEAAAEFSMAWSSAEEAAVNLGRITVQPQIARPRPSSSELEALGMPEVYSVAIFLIYMSIMLIASLVIKWRGVVVDVSPALVDIQPGWPFEWVRLHMDVGDATLAAMTLITGALYLIWGGQRAEAVGWLTCFFLTIALLPSGPQSRLTTLLQTAFRRPMKLHRLGGRGLCLTLAAHIGFAFHFWTTEVILDQMSTFNIQPDYSYSVCILSGVISSCLFGVSVVLSWGPIRRRFYWLFQCSHLLILPATVFSVLHCPKSLWLVLCALVAWGLEKALGAYQARTKWDIISARALPGDALEIEVAVENTVLQSFQPGQYVLLRMPGVSRREWVPLSIASGPGGRTASFIARSSGQDSWGHKVRTLLCGDSSMKEVKRASSYAVPSEGSQESTIPVLASSSSNAIMPCGSEDLEMGEPAAKGPEGSWLKEEPAMGSTGLICNIAGPFGCLGVDFMAHKVVLLVAGGAGATPIMSICEYLLGIKDDTVRPHVHLVWMAREIELFSGWRPLLLGQLDSHPDFTLHLHHTTGDDSALLPPSTPEGQPITVSEGRCNIEELFSADALVARHRGLNLRPGQVGVYGCGPEELQTCVRELADTAGYSLHREAAEL